MLQHALLYGDRQHKITIAPAALDSLKSFVETSETEEGVSTHLSAITELMRVQRYAARFLAKRQQRQYQRE